MAALLRANYADFMSFERSVAAEQPFSSGVLCRLGKNSMPMLCRLELAISVQMFPFLCVL